MNARLGAQCSSWTVNKVRLVSIVRMEPLHSYIAFLSPCVSHPLISHILCKLTDISTISLSATWFPLRHFTWFSVSILHPLYIALSLLYLPSLSLPLQSLSLSHPISLSFHLSLSLSFWHFLFISVTFDFSVKIRMLHGSPAPARLHPTTFDLVCQQ